MTSFEGVQKGKVENETQKEIMEKQQNLAKITSASKISSKVLGIMSDIKYH